MKFLKLRIIITSVINVFLITYCNRPSQAEILRSLLFEKENMQARLEILFEREISFASSKNPQKIFIARNVNEEILALVYSEDGKLKLFKKFIYTHPLYGQYEYNSETKTWLPKEFIHSKELCLIRKIDFFQLPGDSFYSIFLEVLLEEPPIGLFSVPFVIREGEIIFNGLEELSSQKFLKENHYSTFQYKDGKLEVLTNSNKLGLTYIYDRKRFLLITK